MKNAALAVLAGFPLGACTAAPCIQLDHTALDLTRIQQGTAEWVAHVSNHEAEGFSICRTRDAETVRVRGWLTQDPDLTKTPRFLLGEADVLDVLVGSVKEETWEVDVALDDVLGYSYFIVEAYTDEGAPDDPDDPGTSAANSRFCRQYRDVVVIPVEY